MQSILEFDGWLNIDLYHALDKNQPNVFTLRGNVTVSSITAGTFQLVQQHLSAVERNQIKELAEADKFYRLKAVVTHSHNGAKSTFLTSSKAVSVVSQTCCDRFLFFTNEQPTVSNSFK